VKARALIPFAVFAVLVVLLAVGLTRDPKLVPSPLINKPAPMFSLPTIDHPDQQIGTTDFKGKVVLFNVWASWCVACREEQPILTQFAREHSTPVYGLNYKDQRDEAKRWLNYFGNPYIASAFDEKGRVGIDWGVYGVPETFLIDKKGIIRHKVIGPITPDIIANTLLPMIEKLEKES
jgi:cytochrome c biogenesis protein CcmG/thiol:disulfide interchange protein DsbE